MLERADLKQAFKTNAAAFIRLTDALLVSKELRQRFEADPAGTLEHAGFKFRDADALNEFIKGIKAVQRVLVPGSDVMNVAVGVYVGTSPAVDVGTMPVVEVVIAVASQAKAGEEFEQVLDPQRVFAVDPQRFSASMRTAELEAEVQRLRAEVERLSGRR